MNQFDTLLQQVLSEQKRIRLITVKDKDGKTVNTYAPNHIGTKEQELLAKAEKEAQKIGGEVLVKRD